MILYHSRIYTWTKTPLGRTTYEQSQGQKKSYPQAIVMANATSDRFAAHTRVHVLYGVNPSNQWIEHRYEKKCRWVRAKTRWVNITWVNSVIRRVKMRKDAPFSSSWMVLGHHGVHRWLKLCSAGFRFAVRGNASCCGAQDINSSISFVHEEPSRRSSRETFADDRRFFSHVFPYRTTHHLNANLISSLLATK